MAEFDKLSEYADIPALKGQTESIKELLGEINTAALKTAETIKIFSDSLNIKNTGTKPIVDGIKNLDAATAAASEKLAELNNQIKLQQKALDDMKASTGGAATKTKELSQEQALLNEQTKQTNAANRDLAKTLIAADQAAAAGGTTVAQLRLRLKELTTARDTKINILNPADLAAANAEILKVQTALNTIEQGGGNFKNNVGNYTESINILKSALSEATAQLTKLNETNEASAASTAQLKAEYDAVTEKINQQKAALAALQSGESSAGKGTTTYVTELNGLGVSLTASQEQLSLLNEQLQQSTSENNLNAEALAKTQTEVSLLNELVGQQSAGFSSLSREILNTGKALQTLNSLGLQDTAVFEQLEQVYTQAKIKLKEFNIEQNLLTQEAPKIAALTTITRGLAGVYATGAGAAALLAGDNEHLSKELNKLVAVMTVLQGLNEINKLLLEKNAIASILFGQAAAVAAEGAEGAAVATTSFGAALDFVAANPVLLFVSALAIALAVLIHSYESEAEQLAKNIKLQKDYSDAIEGEIEVTEQKNKLTNSSLEDQKAALEAQLDAAVHLGTTQEKELALKKQINAIDRQITDERLKSLPQQKRDLDEQTKALNANVDQLKAQKEETKKLSEQQKNGVKQVQQTFSASDADKFGIGKGASFDIPIEDLIKSSKEKEKTIKEGVDSQQKTVDTLTKIKKEGLDQDRKDQDFANDTLKFSLDERRKLTLAEAQIEAQITQDKNGLILSNEHSTFEQRIAAERSNADALKTLADAELAAVESDPTKRGTVDETIAIKQNAAKKAQIQRDSDATLAKEAEDNTKRILAANLEIYKDQAEAASAYYEEISKADTQSFGTRIVAYADYYHTQQDLLKKDYEFQKATKVLNQAELLALDEDFAKKQYDLAVKSKKEISDIIVSSDNSDVAQADLLDKEKLSKDELNLFKSLKNKKDFAEKAAQLQRDQDRGNINNDIATQKEILSSDLTTPDAKAAARKKLSEDNAKLNALDLADDQAQEAKRLKKQQEYQQLEQLGVETFFSLTEKLEDAAHERKLKRLEDEAKALDDNTARAIENIKNSTLSAQEQATQTQLLDAKTAAQKQQIADQEKAEKIKQARLDKELGEAKIIIQTGIAVVTALASYNYPGAILAGAEGAAELALAIATPIPSYFKETDNHPGGLARYGEVPEVIAEPGKQPRIAWSETISDLAKGTKVKHLDNIDEVMLASMRRDTVRSLLGTSFIPPDNNKKELNEIRDALYETAYASQQILKKQKAPIVIINDKSHFENHINKRVRN